MNGPADALEPVDRLGFERLLQWLRLSFLASPFFVLASFGPAAAPFAAQIAAATAGSYGVVWLLLNRAPGAALRYQLGLRLLDCALVYTVLANYHSFLGNAFYDSVHLLFVVAAAATHGRRGALALSCAAGVAVLLGRLQLIAAGVTPFQPRHVTDGFFYTLFFAVTGLAVAFLMRKSAETVEHRERAWRAEIAQRNASLQQLAERLRGANAALAETAAQLTATNKELEAFAYSVSHDLRAPLRSIDGFSRIVEQRYAERLDEQGRDYLQRVRAASRRMGQLIDDLLSLSRLTRADLRREPVDLSAMAASIVAELRERFPERCVEVSIDPDLRADCDPRLVRVALENLLGNAWKFTGKVERARIEVGKTPDGDGRTAFYVTDDGAGFNMAYADKLFGAFQRLHGVGEFEGTGIGLATVQRIVHRHGGQVWAKGAVGCGATFSFTL
jgi:signal transduction histidine kinase